MCNNNKQSFAPKKFGIGHNPFSASLFMSLLDLREDSKQKIIIILGNSSFTASLYDRKK